MHGRTIVHTIETFASLITPNSGMPLGRSSLSSSSASSRQSGQPARRTANTTAPFARQREPAATDAASAEVAPSTTGSSDAEPSDMRGAAARLTRGAKAAPPTARLSAHRTANRTMGVCV